MQISSGIPQQAQLQLPAESEVKGASICACIRRWLEEYVEKCVDRLRMHKACLSHVICHKYKELYCIATSS